MIRHIPTGLYKSSGHNNQFSKRGKIWRGGTIKNHLRMFSQYRRTMNESLAIEWQLFKPEDCEIIEMELINGTRQLLPDFVEDEMS